MANGIPAYMKIGGQKCRRLKNQMVRRVFWDNKVPGTSVGTRAVTEPVLVPTGSDAEFLGESQVNSSLPCQTRFEQHQDGPGCLKSLGE